MAESTYERWARLNPESAVSLQKECDKAEAELAAAAAPLFENEDI